MLVEVLVKCIGIIQVSHHMWTKLWVPEEMIIHKSLKTGGSVHKTKSHDVELEGASVCHEGCLPFISFAHSDLVVT
jgi:hypothetical protein